VALPGTAGKKGKLPWWGTSGWATRQGVGSTAGLGNKQQEQDKGKGKAAGAAGDGKNKAGGAGGGGKA